MGISLKEVSYSYNPKKKNTRFILKDINLEIKDNDEFVSIIGQTGSGKSTLASIFNALKVPTLGTADIFGITVKNIRKKKENYNLIRKHVGLVFQFSDYQLFEETVLDDVMFGPMNYGKTKEEAIVLAKKALELVHLNESLYSMSPFQLSGGEKKLASIAGILAMEPDILVFDEPTAGLDPDTRKKVIDLFKELNEKEHKSVIIVTHDMNIVLEYSKRVIVMSKPNLIIDTTPYDLFNNHLDIVKSCNIDLPDVYKIIDALNEKCNLNLNKEVKNIDELLEEVLK